jgi:predicted acetyltransferase
MKLVKPSLTYQKSYCRYIKELGDEERYPFPLDFAYDDFDALLEKLENFSLGEKLPKGYVPSTTFWLVEKGRILGVTNLRYKLNKQIMFCGGHIGLSIRPSQRGKNLGNKLMNLSIKKSHCMGVNQIHIHCHKSNLISAKIIMNNGGVLDSEINIIGFYRKIFAFNCSTKKP